VVAGHTTGCPVQGASSAVTGSWLQDAVWASSEALHEELAVSTVEPLRETEVSSSMRVGDVYVNVWTSMPNVEQLGVVVSGEQQMPIGYRSLEIIERMDHLSFQKGVREVLQRHAAEIAGRPAKNIMVIRAGGFAGVVVHGLVGMFNAVGLKTPVHHDIDTAIVDLLEGDTSTMTRATLRPLVEAQIARHLARVPRR